MGAFPLTGLEDIAASIKDRLGKVTLLHLRCERAFQDANTLSAFTCSGIDLICISIQWNGQFESVCSFISELPAEVTTILGGYKATLGSSGSSSGARTSIWLCEAKVRKSSDRSSEVFRQVKSLGFSMASTGESSTITTRSRGGQWRTSPPVAISAPSGFVLTRANDHW